MNWTQRKPFASGWYWVSFSVHKAKRRPMYYRSAADTLHMVKSMPMVFRGEQVVWWGDKIMEP